MLSGEKLLVKVRDINTESNLIVIEYTKNNKLRSKVIPLTDVYNIHYSDGSIKPLYKKDTTEGFYLNYDEAGQFIKGEQFAMKNYKAPWITVGGAVVGAASPLVIQFFYGLIVPTAYTGVMGLTKPCMKKYDQKYPELFNDKYFKSGFVKQAKKKRVLNAIYGSLIGIGVSAITTGIIYYTK